MAGRAVEVSYRTLCDHDTVFTARLVWPAKPGLYSEGVGWKKIIQ